MTAMTMLDAQHSVGGAAAALRKGMQLATPEMRAKAYTEAVEPLREVAKQSHLGPIASVAQGAHHQVSTGANLLAGPSVTGFDMIKGIVGRLSNLAGEAVSDAAKVARAT